MKNFFFFKFVFLFLFLVLWSVLHIVEIFFLVRYTRELVYGEWIITTLGIHLVISFLSFYFHCKYPWWIRQVFNFPQLKILIAWFASLLCSNLWFVRFYLWFATESIPNYILFPFILFVFKSELVINLLVLLWITIIIVYHLCGIQQPSFTLTPIEEIVTIEEGHSKSSLYKVEEEKKEVSIRSTIIEKEEEEQKEQVVYNSWISSPS